MIPVVQAPEPADFDARVRQPGLEATRRLHAGEIAELPSYWGRCAEQMLQAYRRICAYSCLHIPIITGGPSVEHFAPKSKASDQAYEWANYRLVCAMMNSRKQDFEDVLDPFIIGTGLFALNPVALKVIPGPNAGTLRPEVEKTIRRLKLDQADYSQALQSYLAPYRQRHITLPYLASHAPFLAAELTRLRMLNPD